MKRQLLRQRCNGSDGTDKYR